MYNIHMYIHVTLEVRLHSICITVVVKNITIALPIIQLRGARSPSLFISTKSILADRHAIRRGSHMNIMYIPFAHTTAN